MHSTLHFQVFATHTRFRRMFMENVRRAFPRIQPGQSKILEFLDDAGSACQRDIAAACFVEPPTMTVMLAKMEADGVVRREKSPDNQKTVHVCLTPKGRRIAARCKEIFAETEDVFFAALTPSERETLRTLLYRVCHTKDALATVPSPERGMPSEEDQRTMRYSNMI